MTDDVAGVGLWDDEGDLDEADLPISDDLRARVRTWVDEYTETIGGTNRWWRKGELVAHDRRGWELSLDLQAALGPTYRVEYQFETSDLRSEKDRSDRP